jgi:hypothetical protein
MDDFITEPSSASEMDPLREINTIGSKKEAKIMDKLKSMSFAELIEGLDVADDCAYWFQFGVGGPA